MIPKHHWDQHINDENYKQRIWYVNAENSVRAPNMRVERAGERVKDSRANSENWRRHFKLLTAKMLWFCCRNWPLYARNHYICFICRSLSIVHVIWSQQLNFELSSTFEMIQTEIPFRLNFFFIEKIWKKHTKYHQIFHSKIKTIFIQRFEFFYRKKCRKLWSW